MIEDNTGHQHLKLSGCICKQASFRGKEKKKLVSELQLLALGSCLNCSGCEDQSSIDMCADKYRTNYLKQHIKETMRLNEIDLQVHELRGRLTVIVCARIARCARMVERI